MINLITMLFVDNPGYTGSVKEEIIPAREMFVCFVAVRQCTIPAD